MWDIFFMKRLNTVWIGYESWGSIKTTYTCSESKVHSLELHARESACSVHSSRSVLPYYRAWPARLLSGVTTTLRDKCVDHTPWRVHWARWLAGVSV
jgi:hypothetical protein